MDNSEQTSTKLLMEDAFRNIRQAFVLLSSPTIRTRENSLVLTKLEEAMMWCNKDRTIRGFLTKSETHVQKVAGQVK